MAQGQQPTTIIVKSSSNSFATACFVLGIIGFLFCWLPLIGVIGALAGALGLLLGFFGFLAALGKGGRGLGFVIGGGILCGIAVSVQLAWFAAFLGAGAAVNHELARQRAEQASGAPANNQLDPAPLETPSPPIAPASTAPPASPEPAPKPEPPPKPAVAPPAEEKPKETPKVATEIVDPRWHTWTTADGAHTVEARFLSMTYGVVKLEKRDGSVISIAKDMLSAADVKWITSQAWKH